MASGKRKTRIIAATIFNLIKAREHVNKITLVFANEQMRDKERQLYMNFETLLGKIDLELAIASEINLTKVPVKEAVVFDEADVALLDHFVMQNCQKTAALVIGFTATPFRLQDNFESKYLSKLGFVMLKSPYKTTL